MTQKHDPFPELTLGTILRVTDQRTEAAHYTMKLATGEWWEVFVMAKSLNGHTSFEFGEKPIDSKLMKAANDHETVVDGLQVGDIITVGVQVMALPLDAVAVHNATGGKYVRTPEGMVNDQGRLIPCNSMMPETHVWAA